MRYAFRSSVLALSVSLLAQGCGSDAAAGDEAGDGSTSLDDAGAAITGTGPLLPWKAGNTWTYQVTGEGDVVTKVVTLGAEETVGGTGPNKALKAFKVVTKKGELDLTISWQAELDEKIVRYREQSFHAETGELELEEHWDPYKLHVDMGAAHIAAGASWLEDYQETKLPVDGEASTETERDRWVIDTVDEVVTVPAGTFHAIVIQKAGGSNLKTYWYVPGIGKVKETGGQTEELVSYEVAP